ncbi:hypothetical protein L6452_34851 [Arctium lappa]|uniref:Uncharacterized protein n=1 Tax=Arctium lappa TaxID=4217 RepID=A0ACB8YKG3_ARCLA|nr:hypothetical protein L6452_34851 [Arctium lappa]
MTSKDALSIGKDVKPPVMFKGEYEQWKDSILDFVDRDVNGENILLSIMEGPMVPPTVEIPDEESSDSEDGNVDRAQRTKTVPKEPSQYTEEEESRLKTDKQARSLLLQSIPNEIYIKIDNNKANVKKMWDQLQKMMMGSKVGNQMKVVNCINSYEEFKAKENESLEDTYERFVLLLNDLSKNKDETDKDLSDIPLHEVYEMLRQNEDEVEEKRSKKKKAEKTVEPIALVAGQKEKEKKEKKKKKKIILPSSDDSADSNSDSDDGENLKQAMLLLTRAFQKKFYKKPGSNSQRFGERKPEEKKKYVNDYGSEKKSEELIKCYNCRKVSHYAKDCRKPTVRNYDYYKQKMLLAKQKEAGKVLMAEDEFWLDHSKDEKEETTHKCLMGDTVKFDEFDEETSDEVLNFSENDFLTKMEAMMVELQDLQCKLKKEKSRVAKKNQKIFELNKELIGNKD